LVDDSLSDDVVDGVIMLITLSSADEYLSVTLVHGSQLLVVHNGTAGISKTLISTKRKVKLNDAEWHQMNIEFAARSVSVVLHHDDCSSDCSSDLRVEDSAAVAYFGSAVENVQRGYEGFVGCMQDIRVNSDWLTPSWLTANWNASANVSGSCGWNDNCEPDPCNGRGLCTDLWTHSICDCRSPFWGSTCSRGTCVCVSCHITRSRKMTFCVIHSRHYIQNVITFCFFLLIFIHYSRIALINMLL